MATTKIWPIKGWLGQVVHYVENKEKTAEMTFTAQDMQGLRDVMDYAMQDYKTKKAVLCQRDQLHSRYRASADAAREKTVSKRG